MDELVTLKQMCEIVDTLVVDGTLKQFESSSDFWQNLGRYPCMAQMYTECLIYKYIALTYGLGSRPLHSALSQIKNISAPSTPHLKDSSITPNTTPTSSPRGSLTSANPARAKHGSINSDGRVSDSKSTPKRKYIIRRKSEDNKKLTKKSEFNLENTDSSGRRKSKSISKPMVNAEPNDDVAEEPDGHTQYELDNILLSLTYISKMCDLSKWDFTKLREVFLTWNKARGWEQKASDYEYSVMKRFSMSPANCSSDEEKNSKAITDILGSVNKVIGEIAITKNRNVGESIRYWEIRHKILTRPEEAVSVVKCLMLVATKVLKDGDESKILPLLHIFCEAIIMCPHTPLELLQECYSTFEMFYVWPTFVARPVKEVLDMIQLEMKCPGHYFRMIFFQDNEINLASYLAAKMPSSEIHVFLDEDIAETKTLSEAFAKISESQAASSKLKDETEKFRYIIKHIFESVFGSDCCDLTTLEQALQASPSELVPDLCFEALALMEKASVMKTYGAAQNFLRIELEIFSEKIVDFLEAENEKELTAELEKSLHSRVSSARRVSVLYDNCRLRDPASPARASFKPGQLGNQSPLRNNSYLRRTSYGTLDNPKAAKKISSRSILNEQDSPAELIGARVNVNTFNHKDLSEAVFELVRKTAKHFVQEKKKCGRLSFNRKRDSSHFDTSRDSGVIDDDYNTAPTEAQSSARPNTIAGALSTVVQHLRIDEQAEETVQTVKMRNKKSKGDQLLSTSSSNDDQDSEASFSKLLDNDDSDSFWKEFSENGFSGSEAGSLEELLSSMTLDQRKSFFLENNLKTRKNSTESPTSPKSACAETPTTDTVRDDVVSEQVSVTVDQPVIRRNLLKSENKKMNRLSRFVRNKKRSARKVKEVRENSEKMSSAESLASVSSTPSSTTSEESNDMPIPRSRTTSDPVSKQKKRGKWSMGATPTSSPQVTKSKRDRLNVDVTPRSPFNMSVRSLPSRERVSLFASESFTEGRLASPVPEDDVKGCDNCRCPKDSFLHPLQSPVEGPIEDDRGLEMRFTTNVTFHEPEDDDTRRRIDSGLGPENIQINLRRRTLSSYAKPNEQEDLGIGEVKTAMKEVIKSNRRSRMSVSDLEERTVQKKVLKLIFVGNDKTVGHVARAYYEMRRRQISRAPLFQHVDLRFFFIPVSSDKSTPPPRHDVTPDEEKVVPCDVRVGELLGTFDPWYHTVVMLSVNNLLRVYPKIFTSEDSMDDSRQAKPTKPQKKLLTPQEVIASSLLSYSRFAVSKTNINMYKVAMVTSTGEVLNDIFCCRLQAGHRAYTTAVKAGRFGKLGKLVDLSEDSGPPAAYTKIEYSKWSIDGQLIYTGKLEDTFYHTVSISPMSLMKENFRGRDVLNMFLVDNEKKSKTIRRGSANRSTMVEEMELEGDIYNIGGMKMEVTRPSQGTFAVLLDESIIYTSIKSIEVVPCPAPEMEMMRYKKRNSTRNMEHYLMRLPVRTFWPATH